MKLKLFEKVVSDAQVMLTVSQNDTAYFHKSYPNNKVVYLPSFHANSEVNSPIGKGEYVLYHGNLGVAENFLAAMYILQEIAPKSNKKFIIAGLNPSTDLIKVANKYNNVEIIANPDEHTMMRLINEAHIHLLLTFQETGLKLKLLNVLFSGRFCLVNKQMLAGTGLDALCELANTPEEILGKIDFLFEQEFTASRVAERSECLQQNYSNEKNAKHLLQLCSFN